MFLSDTQSQAQPAQMPPVHTRPAQRQSAQTQPAQDQRAFVPAGVTLSGWPAGNTGLRGHRATAFQHSLRATGLFADAALVALIDALQSSEGPRAIEVLGGDPGLGARGGASLVTALRTQPLRLRLRAGLMRRAHYRAALGDVFAGLAQAANPQRLQRPRFSILLSGPGAEAACHADPVSVALLQVRGEKMVWVWPDTPRFLPDAAREDMALGRPPQLPWRSAFDAEAQTFSMMPGDGLTWPLHAPHRTRALSGINVSVCVEYQTDESRLLNATAYVHAAMRRLTGVAPRPASAVGPVAANLNLLAAAALRRIGAQHLMLRAPAASTLSPGPADITA